MPVSSRLSRASQLSRSSLLKNTLASIVNALTDLPEWRGVVGRSEFDQRIVFRKPPPYRVADPGETLLTDRHLDRIRHSFEEVFGVLVSRANVSDAVRLVADRNAFHPIREALAALVWDGAPRINGWLTDYCAVRPTSEAHARLVRSVARKWLISCVARAMKPGSKVDTMLILEGRQGIGKSTAFATLAGEGLFCDSAIDFASKEACLQIQGVWIYELPELATLLRAETSVSKSFLSRGFDRYRVPYGRTPETVQRSVVFCGTVNDGTYLKDPTGHRRFWTVRCSDFIDTAGLGAARDQLWAEARVAYEAGEPWHLTREEEHTMGEEHELREETDPWEECVTDWIRQRGDRAFTMNELLERALGLKAHTRNPRTTQRVAPILDRLGFERRRRAALPRTHFYAKRAAHE